MKYAKWISVLMLLIIPSLAAAQLAEHDRVVIQVPFNFVVGNTPMASGEIIVQRAGPSGQVLVISNADTKVNLYVTTSGRKAPEMSGKYLLFNKYGDRYFLNALKIEGSDEMYGFSTSKLEREIVAQNTHAGSVFVSAAK